jgi:hypothetical protein
MEERRETTFSFAIKFCWGFPVSIEPTQKGENLVNRVQIAALNLIQSRQ